MGSIGQELGPFIVSSIEADITGLAWKAFHKAFARSVIAVIQVFGVGLSRPSGSVKSSWTTVGVESGLVSMKAGTASCSCPFRAPRSGASVTTICRVSLSSASSDLLRVDRGIEANDSRTSGPSFPVKDCVGPWKGQL